jgi:ArsR family transcriptional regulator
VVPNLLQGICKSFADENRFRIAHLLSRSDLCVCELSDVLGLPQTTLSNHLAKLRDSGVVTTRKDGTWVYYQLAPGPAPALFELFSGYLEADATLERDVARLGDRLKMRIGGKCHRSYGGLK